MGLNNGEPGDGLISNEEKAQAWWSSSRAQCRLRGQNVIAPSHSALNTIIYHGRERNAEDFFTTCLQTTSILDLLARPSWTLKLANEGDI